MSRSMSLAISPSRLFMALAIAVVCFLGQAGVVRIDAASAPTTVPADAPYPTDKCIVSGDTLDDDTVVLHYQGREVRLCCHKCVPLFKKDPAKYLKKLDAAAAKEQSGAAAPSGAATAPAAPAPKDTGAMGGN